MNWSSYDFVSWTDLFRLDFKNGFSRCKEMFVINKILCQLIWCFMPFEQIIQTGFIVKDHRSIKGWFKTINIFYIKTSFPYWIQWSYLSSDHFVQVETFHRLDSSWHHALSFPVYHNDVRIDMKCKSDLWLQVVPLKEKNFACNSELTIIIVKFRHF